MFDSNLLMLLANRIFCFHFLQVKRDHLTSYELFRPRVGLNHQLFGQQPNALTDCTTET